MESKKNRTLYSLAWLVAIGTFVLIGILCFRPLPEDSNGVIFMLFGTLSSAFGAVMNYFFGSSKSSSDKTDLIANRPV